MGPGFVNLWMPYLVKSMAKTSCHFVVSRGLPAIPQAGVVNSDSWVPGSIPAWWAFVVLLLLVEQGPTWQGLERTPSWRSGLEVSGKSCILLLKFSVMSSSPLPGPPWRQVLRGVLTIQLSSWGPHSLQYCACTFLPTDNGLQQAGTSGTRQPGLCHSCRHQARKTKLQASESAPQEGSLPFWPARTPKLLGHTD